MSKTVLFIAMSLDGFIAGTDGNINWLQGQEPNKDDMISYTEFIKDVDRVIMGRKKYDQLVNELSVGVWMYEDLTTYVVTHHTLDDTQNIKFINDPVCELIQKLKKEEGKNIWICGGSSIIQPLIKNQLIDRYHISIIPTILGSGIPLFESFDQEMKLKLIQSESYNGITDVIYEAR